MGVVFSNGEDFANIRIYSGSAPAANLYKMHSVSVGKFFSRFSGICDFDWPYPCLEIVSERALLRMSTKLYEQ